jgi:hypothetical protein
MAGFNPCPYSNQFIAMYGTGALRGNLTEMLSGIGFCSAHIRSEGLHRVRMELFHDGIFRRQNKACDGYI